MKALSILLLLLLLYVPVGAGQNKEGFMEHAWGTPLELLERQLGLQRLTQQGAVGQYRSNITMIGEAHLQDCYLEFTDGKLSGVFITTQGTANTAKLLRELQQRYGKGDQIDPRSYEWFQGDTSIEFDEDSAGDATVYWYGISWQKGVK